MIRITLVGILAIIASAVCVLMGIQAKRCPLNGPGCLMPYLLIIVVGLIGAILIV